MSCEKLDTCPFFNDILPDVPATAELLKDRYCRIDFKECARYIVSNEIGSEKVPKNLFPHQTNRIDDILNHA